LTQKLLVILIWIFQQIQFNQFRLPGREHLFLTLPVSSKQFPGEDQFPGLVQPPCNKSDKQPLPGLLTQTSTHSLTQQTLLTSTYSTTPMQPSLLESISVKELSRSPDLSKNLCCQVLPVSQIVLTAVE